MASPKPDERDVRITPKIASHWLSAKATKIKPLADKTTQALILTLKMKLKESRNVQNIKMYERGF